MIVYGSHRRGRNGVFIFHSDHAKKSMEKGFDMYQAREKIQNIILLFADMICFLCSYFGGGYLWLVNFRDVSVENMKSELFESIGIVLLVYMLIMLFSDIETDFIKRSTWMDLLAGVKASVILIFVTALTIFLQHNNADASRGVYFCIAGINLVLFYVAHVVIKYYLLKIYRNKRATNQVFLVTTSDRVEEILSDLENAKDWAHRLASIAIIDDNQVGKWYGILKERCIVQTITFGQVCMVICLRRMYRRRYNHTLTVEGDTRNYGRQKNIHFILKSAIHQEVIESIIFEIKYEI